MHKVQHSRNQTMVVWNITQQEPNHGCIICDTTETKPWLYKTWHSTNQTMVAHHMTQHKPNHGCTWHDTAETKPWLHTTWHKKPNHGHTWYDTAETKLKLHTTWHRRNQTMVAHDMTQETKSWLHMTWHTRNQAMVAAPSGFWASLQAEQRLTWCPSPPRWWWSGPPAPAETSSASAAGCGTGRSSPACAPRSHLQQAAKKYNATGSEKMQCKGQYDGRTLPFKRQCTEKSALNGKIDHQSSTESRKLPLK